MSHISITKLKITFVTVRQNEIWLHIMCYKFGDCGVTVYSCRRMERVSSRQPIQSATLKLIQLLKIPRHTTHVFLQAYMMQRANNACD